MAHRDWLKEADPQKGKMRTFLLGRLQNHLKQARRHANAKKRGGDAETTSLELLESDGAEYSDEEWARIFDKEWATSVFERCLESLEADYAKKGRQALFAGTRGILTGEPGRPAAEIAEQLGMTEGAVNVAIHRMRHEFRDLIRAEVSESLGPEDDLSEEIRHLAASL